MATINGFVETIRKNEKGIYSLKVDNVWYGCWKNVPACMEGDNVQFQADQNGDYWNVKDVKGIKVLAGGEAPAQARARPTSPAASSGFQGNDERQKSIIYQSSRKDALQFMDIATRTGLVDFGKVKAANKMEAMEIFLDTYTARFVADVENLGHKDTTESAIASGEFVDDEPPTKGAAVQW